MIGEADQDQIIGSEAVTQHLLPAAMGDEQHAVTVEVHQRGVQHSSASALIIVEQMRGDRDGREASFDLCRSSIGIGNAELRRCAVEAVVEVWFVPDMQDGTEVAQW